MTTFGLRMRLIIYKQPTTIVTIADQMKFHFEIVHYHGNLRMIAWLIGKSKQESAIANQRLKEAIYG